MVCRWCLLCQNLGILFRRYSIPFTARHVCFQPSRAQRTLFNAVEVVNTSLFHASRCVCNMCGTLVLVGNLVGAHCMLSAVTGNKES